MGIIFWEGSWLETSRDARIFPCEHKSTPPHPFTVCVCACMSVPVCIQGRELGKGAASFQTVLANSVFLSAGSVFGRNKQGIPGPRLDSRLYIGACPLFCSVPTLATTRTYGHISWVACLTKQIFYKFFFFFVHLYIHSFRYIYWFSSLWQLQALGINIELNTCSQDLTMLWRSEACKKVIDSHKNSCIKIQNWCKGRCGQVC